MIENKPIDIRDKISSKVKDSLLTAKIVRLARSTLREHYENGEWEFSRLLGSGAFGIAALFTETDKAGDPHDEIVVKHVTVVDRESYPSALIPDTNGCYMAMEAYIQGKLNSARCDSELTTITCELNH